jgi:hypothetical protein
MPRTTTIVRVHRDHVALTPALHGEPCWVDRANARPGSTRFAFCYQNWHFGWAKMTPKKHLGCRPCSDCVDKACD